MGSTSNLSDDDLKRIELKHRTLALLSSILFFLGSATFLVYVVAETQFEEASSFADSVLSKATVCSGYLLLSFHCMVEMAIDCQRVPRIFAHSRYGRVYGTKRSYGVDLRNLNLLQSALFMLASFSEMAAFMALFQLRSISLYSWFNVLGSCLLLTSAALTLVIRGCCWVRWTRSVREMLDQTANGVYVVATVAWMFACLNQFENFHDAAVGALLQDLCMCSFAVCGVLYILSDLRRFCEDSEIVGRRRPLVRRTGAGDEDEDDASESSDDEPRRGRRTTRGRQSTKSISKRQSNPSWANPTSTGSNNIVTEKYSSDVASTPSRQVQLQLPTGAPDDDAIAVQKQDSSRSQLLNSNNNTKRDDCENVEERTPAPASPTALSPVASAIEMTASKSLLETANSDVSSLSAHTDSEMASFPTTFVKKKRSFLRRTFFQSETLAV